MRLTDAYRLNLTDVSYEECPRKAVLAIKSEILDIRPPFEESTASITGKIAHSLLQDLLTWNFELVNYYYARKEYSVEEALISAIQDIYQIWETLIETENPVYPWRGNLRMQQDILDNIDETIPKLAFLAQSVIKPTEEKLINMVLGTEFQIEVPILQYAIIIGKIDLIAWGSENELRVIELKTGTKKVDDENQVCFYAEVIKRNFQNLTVIPERWRTKGLKRGKIDYFDPAGTNYYHDRAKSLITQAINLQDSNQLPSKRSNQYVCRWCQLCDHVIPKLEQTESS